MLTSTRLVMPIISLILLGSIGGTQALASSASLSVTVSPRKSLVGHAIVLTVHTRGIRATRVLRSSVAFGDGTRKTARGLLVHPSHRYRAPGRYRIVIRALLEHGRSVTSMISVTITAQRRLVLPAPGTVPVVCEQERAPGASPSGPTTLYEFAGGQLHQFARFGPIPTEGWTVPAGLGCDNRRYFSKDFTKYLFAGVPPRGAVEHIAVYDLHSGRVTDLTAARQGNSFSSPNLEETEPEFLGPGGARIQYGSDLVAFRRNPGLYVTSLSHPAEETAVTATEYGGFGTPGVRVIDDHFEQSVTAGLEPGGSPYPLANPDGTLLAGSESARFQRILIAWAAGSPGAVHRVACPTGNLEEGAAYALGWRDATHLVVTGSETPEKIAASELAVATLAPDGSLQGCRALLPPTEKSISDPYLSLDGRRVIFTLNSVAGPEIYAVSTSGDAPGSPVRATAEWPYPSGTFSTGSERYGVIFEPVNP